MDCNPDIPSLCEAPPQGGAERFSAAPGYAPCASNRESEGAGGVLDTVRVAECIEFMATLPDACVDAVIADLPYGSTQNAWDTVIDIPAWWEQVRRLCRGAVVMTACQPFTSRMVMSNLEWFKWADVWRKSQARGHLNAKVMPLRQHEDILVFGRGRVTYNPQWTPKPKENIRPLTPRTKGSSNYGEHGLEQTREMPLDMACPRSVVDFDNCQEWMHPTQKPIELLRYLVRTYTNPGDVVLDMCCGSGTTLLAAKQEGRHFIGCDREAQYVAISRERVDSEFFLGGGGGFSSEHPSTAEKGHNENKISHRWRGRVWRRETRLESWKTRAYAGQWLAASLG